MSKWENYRSFGTPAIKPRDSRSCEHCKRPLVALFTTLSCNHCESPPKGLFYVGYVAFRLRAVDVSYYVFYARKDAEAWGANLHEAYEVRVVLKPAPFTWIGMREGILDERTYKVMPDHRFEVGKPNHAFLAPSSVSLDCAEKVFL